MASTWRQRGTTWHLAEIYKQNPESGDKKRGTTARQKHDSISGVYVICVSRGKVTILWLVNAFLEEINRSSISRTVHCYTETLCNMQYATWSWCCHSSFRTSCAWCSDSNVRRTRTVAVLFLPHDTEHTAFLPTNDSPAYNCNYFDKACVNGHYRQGVVKKHHDDTNRYLITCGECAQPTNQPPTQSPNHPTTQPTDQLTHQPTNTVQHMRTRCSTHSCVTPCLGYLKEISGT